MQGEKPSRYPDKIKACGRPCIGLHEDEESAGRPLRLVRILHLLLFLSRFPFVHRKPTQPHTTPKSLQRSSQNTYIHASYSVPISRRAKTDLRSETARSHDGREPSSVHEASEQQIRHGKKKKKKEKRRKQKHKAIATHAAFLDCDFELPPFMAETCKAKRTPPEQKAGSKRTPEKANESSQNRPGAIELYLCDDLLGFPQREREREWEWGGEERGRKAEIIKGEGLNREISALGV